MPPDDPELHHFADALVSLGQATALSRRIEEDLTHVLKLLETTPDLRAFLANPAIEPKGKKKAIAEIAGEDVHAVLLDFLYILIDRDAMRSLPHVADLFYQKQSGLHGKVAGELVTNRPLPDETVARMAREAGRLLGKDVSLHVKIDSSLIGGARLTVGDFVLDGTIDARLDSIRRCLTLDEP